MRVSVSVYFSNQIIQIAVGGRGRKASLKNVYTTLAPEGSIINGIIMDAELLGTHLKQFWESCNIPKKDVYLVLNSNKIAGKNIAVPDMNRKKTIGFILREFADMQREDVDSALASISLGADRKTRTKRVYAEIAPKDQLREFIVLFEGMGINLKGIISSEGSIIGYARQKLVPKCKTFILQIVNGNLVSNVLFIDGEFRYYNSVRCFNEPGTPEYTDDLARSLNQLGQFMAAEKIQANIEKIFLAGTNRDDISMYSQAVREHGTDAPCELVNTGLAADPTLEHEAQKSLYAISGLYDQGSDSNFLSNFSLKDDEENVISPQTKGRIILVLTTLILMLIFFGITLTMRLIRESQYDDLKSYNDSPNVKMQAEMYDTELQRRDANIAKYNSIITLINSVYSYSVCTDEVLKRLNDAAQGLATIEIKSFDAEAGKVSFSAKSVNVDDIYKYIDKLLEEDIFVYVEHTGYSYDNRVGMYDIRVDCTLAESVGREE